jgi:hypothetical protein
MVVEPQKHKRPEEHEFHHDAADAFWPPTDRVNIVARQRTATSRDILSRLAKLLLVSKFCICLSPLDAR